MFPNKTFGLILQKIKTARLDCSWTAISLYLSILYLIEIDHGKTIRFAYADYCKKLKSF